MKKVVKNNVFIESRMLNACNIQPIKVFVLFSRFDPKKALNPISGVFMAKYNPSAIEPKWQHFWDEKHTFKTGKIHQNLNITA